ncbi:hypothetical protein M427DRAFT_71623 [Gonapodya prolifera JEL478]|uniref:DNA endonuclease activator Ctp1 C-terminal domain-containing protein n=1 Tax=Gonapodya prolifera (strain JEL478) TaxID=1344416 RepID=A0A139A8M8_GONPJ|nr:hypothetical protein M427DRAFT_71623 [Gonapodya prolifera JEL478]|eukprot:KXS13038.1 hypothetical protein M427DRAFT_71623 [Gonapodya prolifera JEL478]
MDEVDSMDFSVALAALVDAHTREVAGLRADASAKASAAESERADAEARIRRLESSLGDAEAARKAAEEEATRWRVVASARRSTPTSSALTPQQAPHLTPPPGQTSPNARQQVVLQGGPVSPTNVVPQVDPQLIFDSKQYRAIVKERDTLKARVAAHDEKWRSRFAEKSEHLESQLASSHASLNIARSELSRAQTELARVQTLLVESERREAEARMAAEASSQKKAKFAEVLSRTRRQLLKARAEYEQLRQERNATMGEFMRRVRDITEPLARHTAGSSASSHTEEAPHQPGAPGHGLGALSLAVWKEIEALGADVPPPMWSDIASEIALTPGKEVGPSTPVDGPAAPTSAGDGTTPRPGITTVERKRSADGGPKVSTQGLPSDIDPQSPTFKRAKHNHPGDRALSLSHPRSSNPSSTAIPLAAAAAEEPLQTPPPPSSDRSGNFTTPQPPNPPRDPASGDVASANAASLPSSQSLDPADLDPALYENPQASIARSSLPENSSGNTQDWHAWDETWEGSLWDVKEAESRWTFEALGGGGLSVAPVVQQQKEKEQERVQLQEQESAPESVPHDGGRTGSRGSSSASSFVFVHQPLVPYEASQGSGSNSQVENDSGGGAEIGTPKRGRERNQGMARVVGGPVTSEDGTGSPEILTRKARVGPGESMSFAGGLVNDTMADGDDDTEQSVGAGAGAGESLVRDDGGSVPEAFPISSDDEGDAGGRRQPGSIFWDPKPGGSKQVQKQADQPWYKFTEVVRNKNERKKMHGSDCQCCRKFYAATSDLLQPSHFPDASKVPGGPSRLASTAMERQNRMSRHRHLYKPPDTPPGFWDVGFQDTPDEDRDIAKKK